jgi:hypothetical protein
MDPDAEVTLKGPVIILKTLKGLATEEVKVEPGEKELTITHGGLSFTTRSFTLNKGDKKTVTISLIDSKLVAKLGDEILMEQDVKSAPAGPGVKPPQGVAQSPPDEKKKHMPAMTASGDPDRTAAEWVLSIGGAIRINESGQGHEIRPGDALPGGAFELMVVNLEGNPEMSDAGLACFKDCKNLALLNLGSNTKVTDAGLAYFKDCQNLTSLQLDNTEVTDAGLERLAGFRELVSVFVKNTNVTEAGVKKLAAALPRCKIEWDGGVIAP